MPAAEMFLHGRIQVIESLEMEHLTNIDRRATEPVMNKDVSGHVPIDHPVPEDFHGHDLVIPKQLVVLFENQAGVVKEYLEQFVVKREVKGICLSGEIALDQFAGKAVGQSDEIIAR